jgi:hypothetical protein
MIDMLKSYKMECLILLLTVYYMYELQGLRLKSLV